MSLEFTLRKLRKKAVRRVVVYGFFALAFLRDREVAFLGLVCAAMAVRWGIRLLDIRKYPDFLQVLNGGKIVRAKKLAGKLGLTGEALGRRIRRLKDVDLLPKAASFEKNGNFVLLDLYAHSLRFWLPGGLPEENQA